MGVGRRAEATLVWADLSGSEESSEESSEETLLLGTHGMTGSNSESNQYALFATEEALPVEPSSLDPIRRRFSDFVVYVDESGDHSLASVDSAYPVFVLALCVFHKRHYAEKSIPAIEKLKFNYFGHDSVVLHEHEKKKKK